MVMTRVWFCLFLSDAQTAPATATRPLYNLSTKAINSQKEVLKKEMSTESDPKRPKLHFSFPSKTFTFQLEILNEKQLSNIQFKL